MSQRKITRGALYLLIGELGLSLIFLLMETEVRVEMAHWLTATSVQVWEDLKIWTLVTSSLMNNQLVSLLVHGLILWLFVPTLERWWGTKKLLLFALWTSLAGTVAGTLLGLAISDATPVVGLDAFIYSAIIAYGVLYAHGQVQFFGVLPITGRQLMFGIIAVAALFVLLGARWVTGASYAAAMTLAYLMTSGKWTPKLWYLRWKYKRMRGKSGAVRDEDKKKWLN